MADAPDQRVDGHGAEQHQRRLRRGAEPGRPVEGDDRDGHVDELRHQRERRHPPPPQDHDRRDRGHRQAVVHAQAELRGPPGPVLGDLVEQQLVGGHVEAERPAEPGGHHHRQPVGVVAGVADGLLAVVLVDRRPVDEGELRSGLELGVGLDGARVRPRAERLARVGRVAVGDVERRPELRGQRGGVLEAKQVGHDPRRQHRGGRDRRHEGLGATLAPAPQPDRPQRQRPRQQRHQQDALRPGQRRQADRPADEGEPQRVGPPPAGVGGDDHHHPAQQGQRLGHDRRVVHPDVGVDGGDEGGDQPRPPAGDLPPGDAHQEHRGGAEQRREQLVVAHRVEPEQRGQGQHGLVAGRVVGAGHPAAVLPVVGVDVALAIGQEVGGVVVVVRVAGDRLLGRVDVVGERVRHPDAQAQRANGQQRRDPAPARLVAAGERGARRHPRPRRSARSAPTCPPRRAGARGHVGHSPCSHRLNTRGCGASRFPTDRPALADRAVAQGLRARTT